jgi:hypothetical protein
MNAVNTHGLYNLTDFLPKRPGEVEQKVMTEMFEASVDGEAYDPDRWSQYFRPAGMAARTGDPTKAASPSATATSQSAPAPATESMEADVAKAEADTAPAAEPAPEPKAEESTEESEGGGNAQDILAMIRARQNQ